MADTYLRSKEIPDLISSSSGTDAGTNPNGPVSWYAQRIFENNHLVSFEPMSWTQTTKEILEDQDLVIFMEKSQYDESVRRFGYNGKNFEIWDVADLKNGREPYSITIPSADEIYKKITTKVDDLIARKF